jgi:translation initiation factor 3 subunit C
MLHETVQKNLSGVSFKGEPSQIFHQICVYLFEHGSGRVRTRSMLGHIYHHALHNRFSEARDLLLMSHLQETIQLADVATQILYNRALAQLGLCAFRLGLIKETHNALNELCSSGKTKELMAQGFQALRHGEKTPEQDKLERQRQLPFHMHINLELLECVYLTSSMLLEIPYMAASAYDFGKKKILSKPFRRMLEYSEKQTFSGPPENTRDHIMAAAKALAAGDWEKTIGFINNIKVWDYMPGAVKASEIKAMLAK